MTPPAAIAPVWPALIKHEGDDELSYVASLSQWQADPALSAYPYQDNDILLDSLGQVFELHYSKPLKDVILTPAQIAISLRRFSELVQMHLVVRAQCCVSKTTFTTYQQGFDLIASIDESS